jgi:anti-sigma-K factor RskA
VSTPSASHHNHHADELLEDYLLGTLPAEDAAWMQAHVETCPQCQAEIAPLLAAVQALPYAAPPPEVPASEDLWDRIERTISNSPTASEPSAAASTIPVTERPASNVRTLSPARTMPNRWLAIAALMILSLMTGAVIGQLLPQVGDDEPEAQQIEIQFTDPGITATGSLQYLPEEQVFVLELTGMPAPPEGYVYQAWLIDGNAPIPVGVMNTESGEFASAGDRDQFQTFAITVEQGPLGNPAPTSEPVLVAALHETDS